jgi:4-diphosphocytidyl-2-C-methyl-D-erythritol kinase
MLTISARAKVNLGLEILGRRPNGFHDVMTILQEIDLADRLTFVDAAELTLESNLPALADDPDNLVLRAARRLQVAAGVRRGAEIHLDKLIPIAAGLGGGSSDAAATLIALNRLWEIGMSHAELLDVAREIGTDVAFFLAGGTQLATGLGDQLEPLPRPLLWVVLIPGFSSVPDKTRRLYAALRPDDWSDGREVAEVAALLRAGKSIARLPLPSGFSRVTRDMFPELANALAVMRRAGAVPSLCGAGPSIMSVHDDHDEARRVAENVRRDGLDARVARTVGVAEQIP